MFRPLLITSGSRGDIEPLFALADGLTKSLSVDDVYIVVPTELKHLAPKSPKLTFIGLKYSLAEAVKHRSAAVAASRGSAAPYTVFTMLSIIIRELILHEAQSITGLARSFGVTAVVTTYLTFPIARIISELKSIPYFVLHMQPVYPSSYYPDVILHAKECATSIVNLQNGNPKLTYNNANLKTHSGIFSAMTDKFFPKYNDERVECFLQPLSINDVRDIGMGLHEDTHVLIAMQSQLLPRAPDFPSRAHIVGSLGSAYIPPAWSVETSQPELSLFFANGAPPVVITYGSMTGIGPELTRILIRGLRSAEVDRVVLIPGNARLGLHDLDKDDTELLAWARQHVFVTSGNVQYAWLFARCAMVLCHCGAGTTGAALRAGLPVLATPVITDKVFFRTCHANEAWHPSRLSKPR